MRKIVLRPFAAAAIAMLPLAAFGQAQPTGTPYVIGATFPLSGPQATYGNTIAVAMQLGADDVNRHGGVKGHPIKLVVEDTGGNPQGGIAAMRKLVEVNGARAIITGFTSITSAQIPLADELKIPTLSGVEAQGAIPSTAVYTFGHAVRLIYVAPLFGTYWKAQHKKRIFAIFSNNAQGQGMSPPIRDAAVAAGADYQEVFVNPADVDFRGVLARIKDYGPDQIVLPAWADTNEVSMIRQIRELGINAPFLEPANNYGSGQWRAAALPYLEGMVLGGVNIMTTGAGADFTRDFRAKLGVDPGYGEAEDYDDVHIIANAMSRSDYTGESIRNALATTKGIPSVLGGTITMGPDHYTRVGGFGLWLVKNGQEQRIAL